MKNITLALLIGLISTLYIKAQNDLTDKGLYHNTYPPEAVVDKTYGITMYEPLNMMIGKDTVRNDESGYAANGYMEDFYTTGQLLHKGFYVDGQLKVYKNYYQNGNVERNFRLVDLKKSKMTLYYEDGTVKSEITYIMSESQKWQDFYPNGQLEFIEEYDKDIQYYKFKATYQENGTPQSVLELDNKKKIVYIQSDYHENGKLKEQGQVQYDMNIFDYKRIGTWKKFDENGSAIKEVRYLNGAVKSEKDL